jgi:Tfp pilus assembly major pilin PilA
MKINRKKQRGATLVTWMIVAGFGILAASAVVKVAPYYVEFNSVKGLMKNIASEPGIKNADKRIIYRKVEKYLDLNNLRSLETSYYGSRGKDSKVKNPFHVTKLKKGNNRKKLSVEYPVKTKWIGNLSFLIDFKHSVVLGEPDNETGK